MYIVTIKVPRNPEHDPKNKQTGVCPVSSNCTDWTGQHHSFLVADDESLAKVTAAYEHITRVEFVDTL